MGMNHPSTRSIKRWLENLNIRPGINEKLLTVVQDSVKSMCEREKDAIMMMDEMAIKQLLQYDKPSDSIDGVIDHGNGKRRLGAANHVNVYDLQSDGYRFVLTRRIQQDILEHFFAFQRGTQGFCKNPTTKHFRQGFKYSLITDVFRNKLGANCETHQGV
jgi:hypothetical protein